MSSRTGRAPVLVALGAMAAIIAGLKIEVVRETEDGGNQEQAPAD
jgi:hypothetical protein